MHISRIYPQKPDIHPFSYAEIRLDCLKLKTYRKEE